MRASRELVTVPTAAESMDPITAAVADTVAMLLSEVDAHAGPLEWIEPIMLEDARALGLRATVLVRGERFTVDFIGMSCRHAVDVSLPAFGVDE